MQFDEKLNQTWWVLRIALGVAPILAGLDKFFNLLTNWEAYLHPAIPQLLHIQAATFMHVVGIVEIIAGIIVLSNFTRIGAYVVMAWLIGIALSLVGQGRYLDVAVRDLLISVSAFSLAKLTEIRQSEVSSTSSTEFSSAAAVRRAS